MTKPTARFGVDFDDDLFICIESLPTDALNIMHSGISTDTSLINLHWSGINKSGINSATVSYTQSHTDYGLRLFHVVTGTNTTAGGYFGWTGSGARDFTVSLNTTYTAVFWIKFTVGAGVGFTAQMSSATGSTTFTASTSWQKVAFTFSSASLSTQAFKITKTNSATNCTFDATGFMIVAGSSTPVGFNVGHVTNIYDNITADVKNYSGVIGKNAWDQKLFDEGKATLTLDNTSQRYSPEYSSSPLYGYMNSRRRFTADIQNSSGTYVRRFTGWAANFAPDPGSTRAREMKMTCHQGKFLLDRVKYNRTKTGDFTADQIIQDVLLKGYLSAATGLQTVLNRSQLNKCYLTGATSIMTLDTGISTIPGDGADNWVDVSASYVLESVINVDQGFLFIDADGMVVYYNRDHYFDPAYGVSATAINLDSEVQSSRYVYGANYANTVRVDYYPPSTRVDTLWSSRTGIYVSTRATKEVDVKFEYTEGKKPNVRGVAAFGSGTADSTISALRGTLDLSSHVQGEFELRGGGGKLTLRNYNYVPVLFSVSLMGTLSESYGGQKVTVTDTAGLVGGQVLTSASSKLLPDETTAANLADYLLYVGKQNVGQFQSITMVNKSDAALDKMLSLELGSAVTLSETQTAHSSKEYFICGIEETWRADGLLSTTMNLSPVFRYPAPWIMGTSVLGTSTILGY